YARRACGYAEGAGALHSAAYRQIPAQGAERAPFIAMASEAPPFWWEKPDWRAFALYPVSALYGAVARRRMHAARRQEIDAPVLCIGNLTVGGAGKTPVAIALARTAAKLD